MKQCNLYSLGLMKYSTAYDFQIKLLEERQQGKSNDSLIILEHYPVITVGKSGKEESDFLISKKILKEKGIEVLNTDRGGRITLHCPGQLVAYPVIDLNKNFKDIHEYFRRLEETVILTLGAFGIKASRIEGYTGVWVGSKKIASMGVGVKKWITYHGVSLNINPDSLYLSLIKPCGIENAGTTSMSEILHRDIDIEEVRPVFLRYFGEVFGFQFVSRLPPWIKRNFNPDNKFKETDSALNSFRLNTVCESAKCPNIYECFSRGTATFMILGDICTRNCNFCNVSSGVPGAINKEEPGNIAKTVKKLGLKHVVITSVTRDDLPDGGAGQFADTISRVRSLNPGIKIEVLIPDFKGNEESINQIINAEPDIIGHNIETVPGLYPEVRPQAEYNRSIKILHIIKERFNNVYTKSGLMLGLGETRKEAVKVMKDLKEANCDIVTIGQYLQPTEKHLPVKRFVHPDEFKDYRNIAQEIGFKFAFCGPFVRSSYMADKILQ